MIITFTFFLVYKESSSCFKGMFPLALFNFHCLLGKRFCRKLFVLDDNVKPFVPPPLYKLLRGTLKVSFNVIYGVGVYEDWQVCFYLVMPFMLNHTLGVLLYSALMLLLLMAQGALTLVLFVCAYMSAWVCLWGHLHIRMHLRVGMHINACVRL